MKALPVSKRPYFARRVLDIGAGHNPFKGVTHIIDIDLREGRERGGKQLIVPYSAALLVGEAMALPFQNASFDYVYASHVLEHVDAPAVACQEIMRVGAAGYIETPSPFLEQGLALRDEEPPEHWFHKWFVFAPDRDRLVFEPKTSEEVNRFCSCPDGVFMREFFTILDFREAQHCFRRKAKTTIFYWIASFGVEVRDRTADCLRDGRQCRFVGMKRALLANCNDLLRIRRLWRFRQTYPQCRELFRRYGCRTVFV